MRDADEKRRSRGAAATRSADRTAGTGRIEEPVEVLDPSGVSWLATRDAWLRWALDVRSAEPLSTTPTTPPRSGAPRARSPGSRDDSSRPDPA